MGLVMVIFALYIGRVQITPEHYLHFLKSAKITFLLSAFLCGAGIFASLTRGKVHHDAAGRS
jgi:hypothetical protein